MQRAIGSALSGCCLSQGTSSRCYGLIVMVVEALDHSSCDRELHRVERGTNQIMYQNKLRKQIGDLPKPKESQSNLPRSSGYGESPTTPANKLRQAEGNHRCIRRTLHEEQSMGASDEGKHLRNSGGLGIGDGVQLLIIVV